MTAPGRSEQHSLYEVKQGSETTLGEHGHTHNESAKREGVGLDAKPIALVQLGGEAFSLDIPLHRTFGWPDRNSVGQYRIMVDCKCEHLIQDLEQVSWKADPHGNPLADLDKSDPKRTHVSDALGYLVAREFPIKAIRGEMSGPRLF